MTSTLDLVIFWQWTNLAGSISKIGVETLSGAPTYTVIHAHSVYLFRYTISLIISHIFGNIHHGRDLTKNFLCCRWRGENVSTTEVEATVSNIMELKGQLSIFWKKKVFIAKLKYCNILQIVVRMVLRYQKQKGT